MDFKIVRPVWDHSRVFKAGQEEQLQKAGFAKKEKRRRVLRGEIVMKDASAPLPPIEDVEAVAIEQAAGPVVELTQGALDAMGVYFEATGMSVEVLDVTGTGKDGRITKADMEAHIASLPEVIDG